MSHSSRFRLIPLVFSLMGESGDSGDDAIRNGTSVCPYRTLICTSLSNFYPRRCVFLDQGSVHRRSLMLFNYQRLRMPRLRLTLETTFVLKIPRVPRNQGFRALRRTLVRLVSNRAQNK